MIVIPLLVAALGAAVPVQAAATADTSYSQQHVHYRIEARLEEDAQLLRGRLRLEYRNNSPVALDTLWFHLHLNAFRPHSAWARRELEYGEARFTNLGADQHAFERVGRLVVDGQPALPVYPGAPDSTVMGVPLARPVAPGGTAVVEMDWDARTSTLPRRQGRRGRHWDFAQWYPRIAVHDRGGWQVQPLLPQGEFYGEFGSYDVTVDVAADQVLAATGVPVEGDPGWQGAAARAGDAIDLRRDAYPAAAARSLGLLTGGAADGRRRVRWRAEDVHHFAWTTSPDYIYEGGRFRDIPVHVLYRPGDADWADGVVVRRTEIALEFFHDIFGPYPWPQLTNVHRIEGGGTEFPMLVMNGSPSQGLILHEVGHNYVHGILANNEWREGWLDEGFVSFLTNWGHEVLGNPVDWQRDLAGIRRLERAGVTQPIGLPSAAFVDPSIYGAMTYTKPSLVFRMLRWLMGEDAFRAGLRQLYADRRLQHFTEADLRRAMSAHHHEDLGWFFDQWIHTTQTLDYRIGSLSATQGADGRWTARVEVIRDGGIRMPVDLRVNGETRRLDGGERVQVVEFRLDTRPGEAVLDPENMLIDIDVGNNRRMFPE
jgi:hypothetical protein